jgi:hypothetical protein
MYPIELCLMFDFKKSVWIEYLAVDAMYCHGILWLTQAYFDWIRGGKSSNFQVQHAHKTLVLLQKRLADSELATSDVTIGVVVALVMGTALVDDLESAKKHMRGLYKMVELRGGVRTFADNCQMQVKMCRWVSKPPYFP